MSANLSEFLNAELEARRWSMRELGRQADVSGSLVSEVINGNVPASANFCVSVARALDMPAERLLRLAGLLPPLPQPVSGEQEALSRFRQIPPAYRDLALKVLDVFAGASPDPASRDVETALHPGESIIIRRWSENPMVHAIQRLGDSWSEEQIEWLLAIIDTFERREKAKVGGGERS